MKNTYKTSLTNPSETSTSTSEPRSPARGGFRLIRLFREHLEPSAAAAMAIVFADQSHLHCHFKCSLGLTPGEYQRRFLPTADS